MNGNYTRRKVRTPLTANQHILHLLLSVLTFGLWIPVWFIRAAAGNVTWEEVPGGVAPFYPADGSAPAGYNVPPIPGSWADRQQRGQERPAQR